MTAQELVDRERGAGKQMTAKRPGRCEHWPMLISPRRAEADQEPWPAIRATCHAPFAAGDQIVWCGVWRQAFTPAGWELECIQRAFEMASPDTAPPDMLEPGGVFEGDECITPERSAELRDELRAMYIETWRGQQEAGNGN